MPVIHVKLVEQLNLSERKRNKGTTGEELDLKIFPVNAEETEFSMEASSMS